MHSMIDHDDRGSHHRDACPAFTAKIFKFSNELERLNIKYNIALVPFFNEKEHLSIYPDFVDQIKSYKGCEIVLHGLTMVSRG